MSASTWNCRVIYHRRNNESMLSVHEVYYDEDKKPTHYSDKPIILMGENMEDLKDDFQKVSQAFDKPILQGGGMFPKEYKV